MEVETEPDMVDVDNMENIGRYKQYNYYREQSGGFLSNLTKYVIDSDLFQVVIERKKYPVLPSKDNFKVMCEKEGYGKELIESTDDIVAAWDSSNYVIEALDKTVDIIDDNVRE